MSSKMLNVLIMVAIGLALLSGSIWSTGQPESEGAETMAEPQVEAGPEFPTKPINFLIPFGTGGSADLVGRALANATEKYLGQPVVPINKPGASGGIMYTELYNAEADGYTVGWNSTSIVTTTTIGNVPFDYNAFIHVCRIGYTAMPIAVLADSPWQTLEEFVDYAKANPGSIKIGNAGTGSGTHLTAVLLEKEAGIQVVHVPLGATRRVPSLLGKEVEAICVPLPEVAPQVQAGQARFLVVSTAERHPLFPDVPTFTDLGYGIVMDLFRGVSVPKGTPQPVVQALMEGFREGSQDEGFVKVAERIGFNVGFQDASEFTPYVQRQQQIVEDAMKFAGMIQ